MVVVDVSKIHKEMDSAFSKVTINSKHQYTLELILRHMSPSLKGLQLAYNYSEFVFDFEQPSNRAFFIFS